MSIHDPIRNAGYKYVQGLELAWASASTITIADGAARDSTNVLDIQLDQAVTVNAAVNGANGLDAGALGNSLMYAVYLIGDSTKYRATAGLLSLASNAAPSLPFGYDAYRRVGYVVTSGAAAILDFHQYGLDEARTMYYDAPISVLAAGAAVAWAEIDLSNVVPAQRARVMLDVDYTPALATNIAEMTAFGSTSAMVRYGCGVAAQQRGDVVVPNALDAGVSKMLYQVVAGDALTLLCAGYEDYLD
jgi:hypothetical protein